MKVRIPHGPLAEFTSDILFNMSVRGFRYYAAQYHRHVLDNGKLGNCLLITPFKSEADAANFVDSLPPHRFNQVFSHPEVLPYVTEDCQILTSYITVPPEFVI